MKVSEVVLALFFPAIAVGLRKGFLSKESGIAWLLELPGHIPSVVYAIGIISSS
jgi:uncharacterized membrane protein YqaE (UPF0057 family)